MRTEFTLFSRGGTRRDLVITGHPAATWGQALTGLVRAGEPVFRGSRPVEPTDTLGSGVLVSGDITSIGEPTPDEGWPLEGHCLAVVGGQAAGLLLPLKARGAVVGREGPADLLVPDGTVSARHARLEVARDGTLHVSDLGSTNGTFVRGRRLAEKKATPIDAGERVVLGQAVVTVLEPRTPDGSVDAGPDGARFFNRVMRYEATAEIARVVLPDPPPEADGGNVWLQVLGSATSLVAGVGSAFAFGNLLYAGIGALGPVVLMGSTIAIHRRNQRRAGQRLREASEGRTQARSQIERAVAEESARTWDATLDPARVALAAIGPTADLWSVDAAHPRAAVVRVGTHDRPATLEIQDRGSAATAPTLVAAPVTVDLRANPVLGIAGSRADARGVARAVVQQLAASRSPDDLWVYHLAADDDQAEWSWLRWLPHTRSALETVHTVSPTSAALRERLNELSSLITQRAAAGTYGPAETLHLPEVLVILDGAGSLRNRSAVVKVLQDGPGVGCRVLALDDHASRLPAEATARVLVDGSSSVLEVNGRPRVTDVTLDHVSVHIAERSARAVAPLQPLGGRDEGALPRSVRFVDLEDLRQARISQVMLRWSAGTEGTATLGVDEHGSPATVSLVDDGPHALVAGTSGSGKSELLRTLVAGLALSASPADLGLLLIDFKGGGAFGKLEHLPHVVGYADDLSIGGVLANRLLESLRAELDYRKTQFKAAGNVEGLPEYRKARARGVADLPPIARLVIVVDEFAELKEAQPDFVDGLVNVARVGRSLGVHLVLATQQPAGVVTPQIRDNANLRICLRVLDPGTSMDLVGTPLAGAFSNRDKGRAVVVSGDAPPTVFQTAYVSAPVSTAADDDVPPPQVQHLPWSACGTAPGGERRVETERGLVTDLNEIVTLLRDCAEANGLTTSRRPWQQPLPERVRLSALLAQGAGVGSAVPFGVEDQPRNQRHRALAFRLGAGNLAIVGGRASGRSTALRTLAASLATRCSADEAHLYVIDHSPTSTLRVLSRLPHCGVVATRAERLVTTRVLDRLRELVAARSALLARHGCATLRELRAAAGDAQPWVVLMVDGWDALVSGPNGEAIRDALVRLAEDGPAVGLHLVVAGGKTMATSRILTTFQDILVLPFDQREDLHAFGVPIRAVPADLPPGRAYRPHGTDAIQIAILDGEGDADAQNDAVRALAATLAPAARTAPMRFEELPQHIPLAEAAMRLGSTALAPRSFIAAVGGDEARARVVDLDALRTPFVVGGPPGSGRTTALAVIAAQLHAQGVPVTCWRVSPHDAGMFPPPTLVDEAPEGPFEPGAVVLVDDAHQLDPYDATMAALFDAPGTSLVLAGDTGGLSGFAGWKERLKSGATGLLFSPQFGEGGLIGATIGRDLAFSAGPGRAYLGARGRFELVQVPVLR